MNTDANHGNQGNHGNGDQGNHGNGDNGNHGNGNNGHGDHGRPVPPHRSGASIFGRTAKLK
jgi:hypothetical protein